MPDPEIFRPETGRAAPPSPSAPPTEPVFAPELGHAAFTPAPPVPAVALSEPARPTRRGLGGVGLVLAGAGTLGFAWLAETLWRWLGEGGPGAWVGVAGGALLALGVGRIVQRELSALRALDEAEAIRAEQVAQARDMAGMARSLERLAASLQARGATDAAALARWREAAAGASDAAQIQAAFVREVLGPVDERALRAIAEAARGAAVLGMVSPTPLADLLLFVGRAVLLLRRLAVLYGLRPGRIAEWRLMRRVVADAALVAGVDAAGDAMASAGGHWLGYVLGRAAEAGVTGQRMARFGLLAMTACRPVPFDPATSPGLRDVLRGGFANSAEGASAPGGRHL
ncbi:DUF697 domain-containing protein [Roseococcus microcysteis]|uniref:DUF697 domain-containing protein n=1 Tax=Roseococcus microcysteis TaxID=2771361 RepID=UPI00168B716D|nr:DUF697 domain-containing protein [Roseococcus microcysteis]